MAWQSIWSSFGNDIYICARRYNELVLIISPGTNLYPSILIRLWCYGLSFHSSFKLSLSADCTLGIIGHLAYHFIWPSAFYLYVRCILTRLFCDFQHILFDCLSLFSSRNLFLSRFCFLGYFSSDIYVFLNSRSPLIIFTMFSFILNSDFLI